MLPLFWRVSHKPIYLLLHVISAFVLGGSVGMSAALDVSYGWLSYL